MTNVTELEFEQRADRLRLARRLSGITLNDIPDTFGISKHTYYAWELGRNPIKDKIAKRIVTMLKEAKVFCTVEWLLSGKGISPRPIEEIESVIDSSVDSIVNNDLKHLQKEVGVMTEVRTFQKANKDADIRLVSDDAMLPFYAPGDYVGGIRKSGNDLSEAALNNNCIVETEDGATYVRRVTKGRKNGTFNLSCINPTTKLPEYTIFSVNLKSAAPILWHRKLPA
ncbi:MAG: hypothetical protein HOI80_03385 [Alphaproteobacteria bacterium]|jgi:transcriptional regulator with XRE-family HTH domain|nr:hypothetical protein [Alphaproteobacteria bacterium]MBT5389994.1 hypothetical protein [Alphaproteobacteria bacterium]MBT5540008.1 hypothetical protein [Alphaproteobacteria bacterium]MBT5654527.1 hypothetical protein [Alphaproteobacteria bacterium]